MKMPLFASLLLSVCCLAFAQDRRDQLPRFEPAACPVPVPNGIKVDCGKLITWENRRATKSRSVEMAVAIVRSTNPRPAPDPVLYTAGGPGVGSMGMLRGAANLVTYTADRDFIVFEQRGTQFAKPALYCPEVNEAIHKARRENRSDAIRLEAEAAGQCRRRLAKEGIDLSAYDSVSSAADIDDLRKLLGIDKLNLYGISYSTRLMLNYVRDYGSHVRSVILDSVLPPTVNWDETGVDNVEAALSRVISECDKDPACHARYPKLREKFFDLVRISSANPIEVEGSAEGQRYKVRLNGSDIVDVFYNLLESTRDLPKIPSIISEIYEGNFQALRSYTEGVLTSGGFIWGMRYSVWCREEMPFQSRKKIDDQVRKHPEFAGFRIQGAMPEVCRLWKLPPALAIENQAFRSEVPALVFGGEFDPDTPAAWGRLVASWFTHGYFIEASGVSHQVMNNRCSFADIPAAFLKEPTKRPDTSCMPQSRKWEFK